MDRNGNNKRPLTTSYQEEMTPSRGEIGSMEIWKAHKLTH